MADAGRLAAVEGLATSWKEMLARRLQKSEGKGDDRRLVGPNES